MTQSPFSSPAAIPAYPQYGLFNLAGGNIRQWEYNGWKAESLSWKKTCYIHAGLSGMGQIIYRGPDALKFLSQTFVNNFSRFKVGSAKHAIACEESGLIAGHGVLQRLGEEEFCLYVSGPWASYCFSKFEGDTQQIMRDDFLFQVAGPTSIDTLEAAAGESLRDIGFLKFRNATIAGHEVQIMRIGMAGSLAFEVHGPFAHAPEIYENIAQAGITFGIEKLGWKTFQVNHVEAGFPQQFWTFASACHFDEGFKEFMSHMPYNFPDPTMAGSVDPADIEARCRNPIELGWNKSVQLDHEFTGRNALEKVLANRTHKTVTLEWNNDDVVDVYASHFREGEEYKYMELPVSPANRAMSAHADYVQKDGQKIGISSGTVYSYHFRKFISHCTLEIEHGNIGDEVTVQWGDHGGPIKEIRATVARLPYLDTGRNQDVDLK